MGIVRNRNIRKPQESQTVIVKGHHRNTLKPQESKVLKVLLEHDYYLSTTEVANLSKISWNTANAYLKKFHYRNWIDKKEKGNRDYWRAYRT